MAEIEWKTLEVPLKYAVQRVGYSDEAVDTIIYSGLGKYGAWIDGDDPYSSKTKITNYFLYYVFQIPETIKDCYWKSIELISYQNNSKGYYQNFKYNNSKYTKTISEKPDAGVCTPYLNFCYKGDVVGKGGTIGFTNKLTTNIRQAQIDDVYSANGFINFSNNGTPIIPYPPTYTDCTQGYAEILDVSKVKLVFEYAEVPIEVNNIYPIDVYIKNTRNINIEWDSSIVPYLSTQVKDVQILSHTVEVSDSSGKTKTYNTAGDERFVSVSSSDLAYFDLGDISYKVTATASNNNTGFDESHFILMGQSSAPDIVSVSDDSFPTVSWTSSDQMSWELVIKQGNEVIYNSGLTPGTETSFKVPVMLNDGVYSFEMRTMNPYGIFTAWNATSVNLNPTKPSVPQGIIVSSNNDYSVSIECSIPDDSDELFVLKKDMENGKATIVGKYYKGFRDYNVPLNKVSYYTIRNYKQGYSDGDWQNVVINGQGAVVRDAEYPESYIYIWMSEDDFDIYITEDRSDTLLRVIGRKYPVSERGEWLTSVRDFNGAVSIEDFNKILKMKIEKRNIIFQYDNDVFPGHISIKDNGKLVNGMRNLSFTITRIDGD